MPTQRYHGGAPLTLVPLNLPGFQGLNRQADTALLGPEWATQLANASIDDNNRLASRKGWDPRTITPLDDPILAAVAYVNPNTGLEEYVVAVDNAVNTLFTSDDGGATFSEITGSASIANPNMQFLGLNNKLYAIQGGGASILVYDGTSFTNVTDVNAPGGSNGLSAFGRLWVVDDDGTTVKYSSLLDGTDWTPVGTPGAADPGQLSVANVWAGDDTVTAMVAFNGQIVVFGIHHILIWGDPTGSELGINPLAVSVVDTLRGVGCVWRELVQNVQGDLWFVSLQGLHSFGRLIQEKSNPLENIAPQVQDYITNSLADPSVDLTRSRSFYSPLDRFFLLSLPKPSGASISNEWVDTDTWVDANLWADNAASGTSELGTAIVFDTRGQLTSGNVRCVGSWDWLVPQAGVLDRITGELVVAVNQQQGKLGAYSGYTDNGESYVLDYESGWMDITKQGYTIIPKRVDGIFYIENSADVTFKWYFDFSGTPRSRSLTFSGSGTLAEFEIAEFGEGEFGGGPLLRYAKVAGAGSGEFIKLGVNTAVSGAEVSLQKLDLFVKVGRLS